MTSVVIADMVVVSVGVHGLVMLSSSVKSLKVNICHSLNDDILSNIYANVLVNYVAIYK